jgi:type II secretory pathway component PulM
MKQWFMMLSSREKTLVSVAAIVVPILLIWLLFLQPMIKEHAALQQQIEDRLTILEKVRQQSTQIKQLRASGGRQASTNRGNPQQKIESALRTWRLRSDLNEMRTIASNTVKLDLKSSAEADNVMRFLYDAETKFGFTVKELSMKPGKEVGTSTAVVTLEAK